VELLGGKMDYKI